MTEKMDGLQVHI